MIDNTPLEKKIKISSYYIHLREWISTYSKPIEKFSAEQRSNYHGDMPDFYIDEASTFIELQCVKYHQRYDLIVTPNRIIISDILAGYEYKPLTPALILGCIYIAIDVGDYGYTGFDKAKYDIIPMMRQLSLEISGAFLNDVLGQEVIIEYLLLDIYETEKINCLKFGDSDFYQIISKENTNDLLHWYETNGEQLETNIKNLGYSWCYVFENPAQEPGKHHYPFIYLFVGNGVCRSIVEGFAKEAMATAPKGMTYYFSEDSITNVDLKKYYSPFEKALFNAGCNFLDVHDASTFNTGDYKIEKKHVRHLDDEKPQRTKRKGRPSQTVRDCIKSDNKDEIFKEMKEEMDRLPDGPTQAQYIQNLIDKGVLSKSPSWKALSSEGMIDIGPTAWNTAMSKIRLLSKITRIK